MSGFQLDIEHANGQTRLISASAFKNACGKALLDLGLGLCLSLCLLAGITSQAWAGDKLLATGGVMQIEGAGGGGLVPWALISGYGTQDQVGGSVFYTRAETRSGLDLASAGVAVGIHNRVELSMNQIQFGMGEVVPGLTIKLNTLGAKVRLFGDAIYEQDNYTPQVSVGLQYKHNEDFGLAKAIGAKDNSGVDYYLAASKLYLGAIAGRNLLLNATLQATKANLFGIAGFGGDKNNQYRLQPQVSAALMLTDSLFVGAEYRARPDNLKSFKEDDAKDIFIAWFPHKNVSITAAYVDLGNLATDGDQTAWYLSGQISY